MIDDLGEQTGVHRSWKKFATGLAIMMSIALRDRFGRSYWSYFWRHLFSAKNWRRGELNPCPRRCPRSHLHVYPALRFREPTLHRRTAVSRASTKFLHRAARSLRRTISLLSTFGAVAGVQLQTSRSIKPRERDLGDLRLFVLARFFTRPTNHPRHAACASNHKSKPVRPHPSNVPRRNV